MTKVKLITIGSDPEFFIRRTSDGMFIPSSLITSGTKHQPEETKEKGYLIHRDNLTIEGNLPPARTMEEFIVNMKFLKDIISLIAATKGFELVCDDSAEFIPRFLKTLDANEYGCSNDYNVWLDLVRPTPRLENSKSRFAGFHLHLGYEFDTNKYEKETIDRAIGRAFDFFLTFPSDQIKYTRERRETYGRYGSTRITPYGIEVRTLGSYFARDEMLPWVTKQVEKMFTWLNEDDNLEEISRYKYFNPTIGATEVAHLMNEFKLEVKLKESLAHV